MESLSQIHSFIHRFFSRKIILFLLIGVLNTAFGYGLFALLLFLKLHYSLAFLIATTIGILFNFKTTGIIVFRNSNNWLIFRFFIVYGITYLAGLLFFFVTNRFSVNNYIAGAVWLLPGALISFFLQKTFVFKTIE